MTASRTELIAPNEEGNRFDLASPTLLPKAGSFLWNKRMMIQVNCRGFAVAQFMQPEPAKYSHAPELEAKSFMQPEQPFYAHHPGRFFYIKDEESGKLFSSPYEPARKDHDSFRFSVGASDIRWKILNDQIDVGTTLSLAPEEPVELWSVTLTNRSTRARRLSLYVFFPVGYMSWMNQSAKFDEDLNAIVCSSITPYQKLEDYFRNRDLKDKTYLASDARPESWETSLEAFEGEGGLHSPSSVRGTKLGNGEAHYEMPVCVMQFRVELESSESRQWRFLFGPAKNEDEIRRLRRKLFSPGGFESSQADYRKWVGRSQGKLTVKTPDVAFDNFVNEWMPRQVLYHVDLNRLSTDPQTRNFLQDNMGGGLLGLDIVPDNFMLALRQQKADGAMPDGIILSEKAKLKYINEVPHLDHCVWLPICLRSYLEESGDFGFLDRRVAFANSEGLVSIAEHVDRAMQWLLSMRDTRGLIYISQGDWCDPMNMVGHKGKGVSGWLSLAAAYAMKEWVAIRKEAGLGRGVEQFRTGASELNAAVNQHLWDGEWYARGITDDGARFGVSTDPEGRVFLNPQAFAILSGAADEARVNTIVDSVATHLESPYGTQLLSPAFTSMREDIGRVTQKFPGSAENGSVYNHAAAFWAYALYKVGRNDEAFSVLRRMIPGPDDIVKRGQLPVYIPNYYRGAFREYPRTAGRSSQLPNTGSVHWFYRCLIDGLFGLRGCREGLRVDPNLPSDWDRARVKRRFRGATFDIRFVRENLSDLEIQLDGRPVEGGVISEFRSGEDYSVTVRI